MASSSGSISGGNSSSSSIPGLLPSPQTDFSLKLSELLQQLGMSQAGWAAQQFAQTSAVTDAQINNYIAQAQQGSGLASNMLSRYENTFSPMEDQYAANAGSYASQGRINNEMGRAESNASQAGNAAKINAEQELQSFGIDPSSGRYQDLVRASDTATAAAAAGAGETARLATEQEGQRRLINSIQMGQQLPGNAVNAMNSAYQGIAGAENAALGNANTGVNLTTSPNQFLQTAQGVKVPPVGNTSTSRSMQGSQSGSASGGGGGGSSASDPFNMDRFGRGTGAAPGLPGSGPNGNAPLYQMRPGVGAETIKNPYASTGSPEMIGPENMGGYDPNDPYSNLDPISQSAGGVLENNGWQGGDYYSPQNAFQDPGNFGGSTYGGDLTNPTTQFPDPGQGGGWGGETYNPGQSQQSMGGGYDTSGWNTGGGSGDLGSWDTQSTQDWGSGSSDANWGDFAGGGQVGQQPQGGGHVPQQMSPSGGRQTDDVQAVIPQTGGRAQLNANEFVIPRDVAMWKGQEFFQKMIAQSRKARMGAPAKPQRG